MGIYADSLQESFYNEPEMVKPLVRKETSNMNKLIYVILTTEKNWISKAISKITDSKYAHTTIAFDPSFENVYGFGRNIDVSKSECKFIKEDMRGGFYKNNPEIKYLQLIYKVTDSEYKKIKEVVQHFIDNQYEYKYDKLGLLLNGINIPHEKVDSFICSGFVAYVFEQAGIKLFDKSYSLVRPNDFSMHKNFHEYDKGFVIDKFKKKTVNEVNENGNTHNELYFLSENNMDGKRVSPRIPDNFFTKNKFEDNKTPRVCFCDSIDKCLMALGYNCKDKKFFVHKAINIDNLKKKKPSTKDVPDANITGETWILEPVELKCIGQIQAKDSKGDGYAFNYGNKTSELYGWDWKWIDKFKKKAINESTMHIKYVDLNDETIKKYKSGFSALSHIRTGEEYEGKIAIVNNEPAGVINVNTDKSFIQALEVSKKFQNQGLGTKLLNYAVSNLNANRLSVRKTNSNAINLYKKNKFKISYENDHQYIMSLKEDSYIMTEAADLLLESYNPNYKRKYKCPYCEKKLDKDKLIRHIEDEHEDMIPEGFTPTRIVFNIINKKTVGHCVQCGKETKWNENNMRYDRFCCQKCIDDYRKIRDERMMRTRGKLYMTTDPEFQKKMLANRKISGIYKFSDGGEKSYVGSYERKCLEFCDKVLHYTSEEVQTPGATIVYYDKEGKQHVWILDIWIVPANLQIDCKDGGDNPNNRSMPEYRAKQELKEKAIREQGEYNYLRLTDNNFGQLLYALADIKNKLIDDDNKKIWHINEYMSATSCNPIVTGQPKTPACSFYVVPAMIQNTFVEPLYSRDKFLEKMYQLKDGKLVCVDKSEIKKKFGIPNKLLKLDECNIDLEDLAKEDNLDHKKIYKLATGKDLLDKNQYFFDGCFSLTLEGYYESSIRKEIIESTIMNKFNPNIKLPITENALFNERGLSVNKDMNGYYIENTFGQRTKSYENIDMISNDIIDIISNDIRNKK